MATPVHVPRINNNDDEVKLIALEVAVGDHVEPAQVLAQIETDKAVVDVESPASGYVLAIYGECDEMLTVGRIFIWLGDTADEKIPEPVKSSRDSAATAQSNAPTAKARALLRQYNLDAGNIPISGDRLSVADVEQYLKTQNRQFPSAGNGQGRRAAQPPAPVKPQENEPAVDGTAIKLESFERGMLSTVIWHRDTAVPGYIEIAYDHEMWKKHAQAFAQEHSLLLDPLLSLMAWRLVEIAMETPRLNATIWKSNRYEYSQVNLGFTVQAGSTLYLVVVQKSNELDALTFVNNMVDLQRKAASHQLKPDELENATIGFSSMSRWNVERHVPILPPQTALMVAHTIGAQGVGVLGASYDHRVLNGGDVVKLLKKLSKPNK